MRYRNLGMSLAIMLGAAIASAQAPTSGPAQQVFPSPKAAADALLDACKNNDTAALIGMLGERYRAQAEKIDDAEERQHRRDFYDKAQTLLKIEPQGDAKAVLIVGRELWPVPIPLVKEAAGWRFDTDAGFEEMLARRVGENELIAIEVCHEYVRAQVEYAAVDRDGDQVREYAQRIASTPGKRNGLYWDVAPESHERPSPLAALLPEVIEGLKDSAPGTPYMGYHYKILTGQGANAPGGKHDYVINGNMIGGFALVAWPADYRASGVMTFLISHQGKLFEKDLRPETAKLAEAVTVYDPDQSWEWVHAPSTAPGVSELEGNMSIDPGGGFQDRDVAVVYTLRSQMSF